MSLNKRDTVQSVVGYLNGYLDTIKEKHDKATDRNDKAKYLLISADIQHIKKKLINDYIELDNFRNETK